MYDVLIIGGGAAGMSCALLLGSAKEKAFASDKNIGIVMHQKTSAMTHGMFNNVLGVGPNTSGIEILEKGVKHLHFKYPHINQIENEKVIGIDGEKGDFTVSTNKNAYKTKSVVVAVGASNLFNIEGLTQYVEPHQSLPPEKNRIQLKNTNHLVTDGIYVAGILAGWISQLAIASGSGAMVAADILREWNNGNPVVIHDSIEE
ncbi:MAG: NAD(P)/FAD-dependent oxidoreductase [Flavobacteriia bacterium]|nr:MAG: NAD(P)/FAD-dependent oxidoreductase [Flavobacteriia bacterium]